MFCPQSRHSFFTLRRLLWRLSGVWTRLPEWTYLLASDQRLTSSAFLPRLLHRRITKVCPKIMQIVFNFNNNNKYQELENTHLFPSCHRDSRIMESAGHRTGAGDRTMHHCHHRGQQRNHLPVSEAVCGSAEGKCGLILRHFYAWVVRHCSHLHLLLISKSTLCASGRKNNKYNNTNKKTATLTVLVVLSVWYSRCSSWVPSGHQSLDKSSHLLLWICLNTLVMSTVSITKSWYLFSCPMEGRRLSRPRYYSNGEPV